MATIMENRTVMLIFLSTSPLSPAVTVFVREGSMEEAKELAMAMGTLINR